ncbi:2,4-dichlorophenol 6-monooxygenase [Cocos nucifera]|uniref:2,4-dichlorophenol 6-monooxygenase n=1 Tax=Cocos nucifera TaxID=13894 RepID=A0A8K0MWN4_COCNU|nr:2,4-dichlorophenol 6-monooxygenase [Cocos nucifera]
MAGMAAIALKRWTSSRSACHWRRKGRSFSSFSCAVDSNKDGGREVPYLPVLIVGAGPVGLFLCILLTKLGVLQLFRKVDGLAEEIQKLQPAVDLWRKFIYCTSLSGSILGSVDHMQPQDFDKIVSPVSVAHFSEYKLVRLLLKRLENLGFHTCTPDMLQSLNQEMLWERKILMGHECISLHPTDQGVMVGASFQKEGKMGERKFHCSILVGSDGARSTVRKLVGIDMKGERDLQKLVSVHFMSKDLGQYLLQQRPGMLFFIFNPEAIGVLVAHDLNQGEFVLQVPYHPPQQKFEDFSSKVCKQIIFKLVGWEPVDVEVVDIKPWVMHAEVGEKFVSCNNRVILVGDAAHRFPPAGGFGMNTGIQDAHNLAWKISSLLNNIASPSIIQTYEVERRLIAISNTNLSVQNFKAAMSVPTALGLDPTIANSVHKVINSSLGSILPSSMQKAILEGIFSIGRSQLSEFFLNEDNPIGYLEGALVADGENRTLETEAASGHRSGPRDYIPSAKPGSRLPHMQVRALNTSFSKDIFSTLDLIPGDKLEFLLIIAPVEKSYDLARSTLKVAEEFKFSLKNQIGMLSALPTRSVPCLVLEMIPFTIINSWFTESILTKRFLDKTT